MPSNHTAPGCMLRFDVRGVGHESSVTVSFTYVDVTSPDPVAVSMGTTFFTDTHQASKVGALESFDALLLPISIEPHVWLLQPLDSFLDSARAQLYMPCVNLSSYT